MGAHRPLIAYLTLGVLLCAAARGRAACDEAGARQAAAAFAQAAKADISEAPQVGRAGGFWAVKYGRLSIFVDEADGSVVHAEDEWANYPSPGGTSSADVRYQRWALRRALVVVRALGVDEGGVRLASSGLTPSGRWVFRWVRETHDIPYEMDAAVVWLRGLDGRLLMADKSFWSQPPASTRASLSRRAATERARQYARAARLSGAERAASAELLIVQPESRRPGLRASWRQRGGTSAPRLSSRLAWAISFGTPAGAASARKTVWVDAQTGGILSDPGAKPYRPGAGARLAPAARLALSVAAFVVLMVGSILISSRRLGRREQVRPEPQMNTDEPA